jgi:hypothetical protein
VTLPDYPPFAVDWNTGLTEAMLRALGKLAVVSAQAEELLHQIYWHHAKLDERSGPIVTDNLNPKRLEEDIVRLVSLDKTKGNILADLKVLFSEFRALNTKRNQCLHWGWEVSEKEGIGGHISEPDTSYRLRRPIYKHSGVPSQNLIVEDVKTFCKNFSWLQYRLRSHTFSDDELMRKRNEVSNDPPINGMAVADLVWPAPWLDQPLSPEPSSPNIPEDKRTQLPRSRRAE